MCYTCRSYCDVYLYFMISFTIRINDIKMNDIEDPVVPYVDVESVSKILGDLNEQGFFFHLRRCVRTKP